jgi:hypothetical protein
MSAPAGGAPAWSGTPAVGGGNLLAKPTSEEGPHRWSAIGGVKVNLADEVSGGRLALSLMACGGRAPGVSARDVTESEADRYYTAFAWIRASRRAATAELNLVEYGGWQRPSADTSGAAPPSLTGRARSDPRDPPGRLRAGRGAGRPKLAQTAGLAFDELQIQLASASKLRARDDHSMTSPTARKDDMTTMRSFRSLLASGTAALVMRPTTGLTQRRAAMQDTSCPGIDTAGTDMLKSATVRLELVDLDNHTTLAART